MTRKRAILVAILAVCVGIMIFPEKRQTMVTESTRDDENPAAIPKLPSHVADVHFDIDPPCRKFSPIGCMLFVTGGTFTMGAQNKSPDDDHYDPDASDHEGPPREVTVGSFWIHREEVKTKQFATCVEQKACSLTEVGQGGGYFNWGQKARDEYPLNGTSWHAADAYCKWLGGRLPTEAEWEFAARGTDGRRFPWGDALPDCDKVKFSTQECGIDGTSGRPAYLGRSEAAVEDMSGSLWEWTSDWYADYSSTNSEHMNPTGPDTGTRRTIRGGGWMDEGFVDLRSSARAALEPNATMNDLGFRCVRPHID